MEAPAPTETAAVSGGDGAHEKLPRARPPRGGTRDLALPNLIVIGAQKCGTSGLHYYLSLHPEVSMSTPKELNFFIAERNFQRGLEWYSRHFDPAARCRGEASPNYTAYPQHLGVPERIAEVVPDVRLVYIVRDPIERITAHFVHNYAKRREKGDMRATLTHPNTSYVTRSTYFMQLQRFLARAIGARPGWRRSPGCSSSPASTPASATRSSSRCAIRRPARSGRRGSGCAFRG